MEKQTLYKFFDGKASATEKEAIRTWLDASPLHQEELLREREFFDALLLCDDLQDNDKAKKIRSSYLKVIVEFLKIAAVFAITIACGTYWYRSEINKMGQTMNTITVPAGQRVNLTLPDGTNVWLNARSKMQYPAIFSGSKREIKLEGEGYFDVTHNVDKPFVVETGKFNVEVLGTKFNVEAYDDSDDFCASLMEGSVRVSEKGKLSESLVLSPNQQALWVDGHLQTHAISDFDTFRWKEGLICFKNINFEQLMLRFEKCYGVRIVIENKTLADYICNGKFRISDGIDNALRILQKDAKYTYMRSKDDAMIYIK